MKKTPFKRSGRIKPKKRSAVEFARVYGSKARAAWVKSQMCFLCSDVPCENAHIVTGGMGRKAEYTKIVPMCKPHHAMLHRMGRPSFERYMTTDLDALAEACEQRWQAFLARGAVA